MKFWEFVLSLPSDQYICWVDHTLPSRKTVYKDGKRIEKSVDPFTRPMKVGKITLDRIGSKNNLYLKDIYEIQSCAEWRGRKYPTGVIFFHVTDRERTQRRLDVHAELSLYIKNGWLPAGPKFHKNKFDKGILLES